MQQTKHHQHFYTEQHHQLKSQPFLDRQLLTSKKFHPSLKFSSFSVLLAFVILVCNDFMNYHLIFMDPSWCIQSMCPLQEEYMLGFSNMFVVTTYERTYRLKKARRKQRTYSSKALHSSNVGSRIVDLPSLLACYQHQLWEYEQ